MPTNIDPMPHSTKKRRALTLALSLGAFLFIGFSIWLIHEANIGRDNILFKTVRATPHGDKMGHVLLAGVLTLIANFFFRHRGLTLGPCFLPFGSLLIALVFIVEEASQYYLPTRSLDINDALANFLGILLASLPALFIARRRTREQST